jgi:hypothetical protein
VGDEHGCPGTEVGISNEKWVGAYELSSSGEDTEGYGYVSAYGGFASEGDYFRFMINILLLMIGYHNRYWKCGARPTICLFLFSWIPLRRHSFVYSCLVVCLYFPTAPAALFPTVGDSSDSSRTHTLEVDDKNIICVIPSFYVDG